jgi:hypothetical protein
MGVQGRLNQAGGNPERQSKSDVDQAMERKRRSQEQAKSIGDQVREKLKAHYEGTT